MSVTSAPIGSTGQSLDGFAVDANVLQAFRESVVLTGPNSSSEVVTPVSTQPINFYGLPVWIQGTPNFSSTVNITSTVNVTSNITVAGSTQIVSSLPIWVSQSTNPWIVAPLALTGTSQVFGTVSTQIVSSIPIIVSQSTNPWTVNGNVTVTNVPQVSLTTSIPLIVSQSTTAWQAQVTNTVNTNITSSIPFFVTQSSSPWTFNGGVSVTSQSAVASTWPLSTTFVNLSAQGVTVSTAILPVSQGGLSAFLKIGVTTAAVTIKGSAGKLHDIWFTNNATSTRWLKFYNASSAAIGTTAPLLTFGMPGTTTGANAIAGWIASAMGIQFSTAIFVGCTASSATSTDTSTPGSADIVLNVGFA